MAGRQAGKGRQRQAKRRTDKAALPRTPICYGREEDAEIKSLTTNIRAHWDQTGWFSTEVPAFQSQKNKKSC